MSSSEEEERRSKDRSRDKDRGKSRDKDKGRSREKSDKKDKKKSRRTDTVPRRRRRAAICSCCCSCCDADHFDSRSVANSPARCCTPTAGARTRVLCALADFIPRQVADADLHHDVRIYLRRDILDVALQGAQGRWVRASSLPAGSASRRRNAPQLPNPSTLPARHRPPAHPSSHRFQRSHHTFSATRRAQVHCSERLLHTGLPHARTQRSSRWLAPFTSRCDAPTLSDLRTRQRGTGMRARTVNAAGRHLTHRLWRLVPLTPQNMSMDLPTCQLRTIFTLACGPVSRSPPPISLLRTGAAAGQAHTRTDTQPLRLHATALACTSRTFTRTHTHTLVSGCTACTSSRPCK